MLRVVETLEIHATLELLVTLGRFRIARLLRVLEIFERFAILG
jgi:hypothetical protein